MDKQTSTLIVGECRETEECLAIVPSNRLKAPDFLVVLAQNGIRARPLGTGTGTVQDGSGRVERRAGVFLVAIDRADESRVSIYARMCGMLIARIEKI